MPKRATHTFESEKDGSKEAQLGVQYCMCCGESVLILAPDASMDELPRRQTDDAIVLIRDEVNFRLKSKPRETKVLKRGEDAFERQYRLGCWSCGVTIGYQAEPGEAAPKVYLFADATGMQADLYLQMFHVPQCIQTIGPSSVRVAVDVKSGQPKRTVIAVETDAVAVSVTAPPREGLANAELLDFVQKVLDVPRSSLGLTRGWSTASKFLTIQGLEAVAIFKKLKAAVDTDIFPTGEVAPTDGPGGQSAYFTAGAASGVARRAWEEGEALDDLADAPTKKSQTFIK